MIIDSHSHIFDEVFDSDREQVMQRALQAGVLYQVVPNVDSSTVQRLLHLTKCYSCCFPLIGLHPTSVNKNFELELNQIVNLLNSHKFYGIGEIGIDLYWDKTFINQQVEAFKYQLNLAKTLHLPIAIHVRDAFDEVFSILDSEIEDGLTGVFHCFTGTLEQYNHIMEYRTFMVGIGGVVTYKNSGINKFVNQMDLSRLILETDSPYLSPTPVRGSRNEPFNITYTVAKVADLLNIHVDELVKITSANTINLFKLPINS